MAKIRKAGRKAQQAGFSKTVHGLENLAEAIEIGDEELDQYTAEETEAERRLGESGFQRIPAKKPADEDTGRGHEPYRGGRSQPRMQRADEHTIHPVSGSALQAPGPASSAKEDTLSKDLTSIDELSKLLETSTQRVEVHEKTGAVIDRFLNENKTAADPVLVQKMAQHFGIKPEHILGRRELLLKLRATATPDEANPDVNPLPDEEVKALCDECVHVGALYAYERDDRHSAKEKAEEAAKRGKKLLKPRVPVIDRETSRQRTWDNGEPMFRMCYYSPADLDLTEKTSVLRPEIAKEILRIYHPIAEARFLRHQEAEKAQREQERQEREQKRETAQAKEEELRSSATLATTITDRDKEYSVADIAAIEDRTSGTFFLLLTFLPQNRGEWERVGSLLVEITSDGNFKPVEYTDAIKVTLEKTAFLTTEEGVDFDTFVKTHPAIRYALRGLAQMQRTTLTGVWIQHDKPKAAEAEDESVGVSPETAEPVADVAEVAADEPESSGEPAVEETERAPVLVANLGLTASVVKALESAGFQEADQVFAKSDKELLAITGVGPQAVAQIRKAQS